MQIHQLQPKHVSRGKKRVGRGGKKGTYSGRGSKGQAARAGRKMVPIIRELIKRYPKLKGYRSETLESYAAVLNLDVLNKQTKNGEVVNPKNLTKRGIVRSFRGKIPVVKILGRGSLDKKLVVEGCLVSAKAREAIVKAGGTVR